MSSTATSKNTSPLRQLRQARGLPQYQLAEECKLDPSDLRRWERGLASPPLAALQTLATFFDVEPNQLQHDDNGKTVTAGEGYVTAQPTDIGITPRRLQPPEDSLRVLDLFCGAGGFSYGLEMAGKFSVTAGIDLLPDRVAAFSANHQYADSLCYDIRKISIEKLSKHALNPDIIVGGPPCQGFSSIRPFRNLTEDDERNNLFESFVLVVANLKPKWFVLENVVGLIQHKRRAAFQKIIDEFKNIGYRVDWRVLNAAMFGLPQNRERVIIVGSYDGHQFQWPNPTHYTPYRSMAGSFARHIQIEPLFQGMLPSTIAAYDAISDLPPVKTGGQASKYILSPQNEYQVLMRKNSNSLTLHESTRHSEKMMEIIRNSGSNRNALPDGMTSSGFSSSYSRLDPLTPSVTLTVNFVHPSSNKCIHPYQDRALTPREGARIQGFPDIFKFVGTRSKIVKQIGNAVPPLLGKSIGEALLKSMK